MFNFEDFHYHKKIVDKIYENAAATGDQTSDSPEVAAIKKEAKKTIDRVIARMVLAGSLKFFTTWIYNARILFDPPAYFGINTMATDGTDIYISSFFVANLIKEFGEEVDVILKFILCHEVLHMALMHGQRLRGRNHDQWNVAGDYEINDILMSDGFITKEQIERAKGLINDKYHAKSAEEIYNDVDANGMPDPPGGGEQQPVEVGSYIKIKKSGKFGRITKINSNGTYEYDPVTEQEATQALS